MLSDSISIWNIRTSERCYAVNHDVKRWARSLPLSESLIEVIPHGIDVPELLRHSEYLPKYTSEHEFMLCYVGSFKIYHCLLPLIKAISQLRDGGIDVGLSLVGTGPELSSVQEAVNEYGISSATTFHGFVDPAGVPEYIRLADACYGVIDPSRTGSPMKVYEYLASGTPVVAIKSEEFGFIDEERVGVLIKKPAPELVANAIEQLYSTSKSERTRMRERAREAGHKHGHTWSEFADQIIA
jgi:glycosyltransferase involved in cell wall biosynthesis